MKRVLLSLVLLHASACGDDPAVVIAPECNPLGGAACVAPFPSGLYEVDDSGTETGVRLAIPAAALPTNADAVAFDPTDLNNRDGWSPAGFVFAVFSQGVAVDNLPSHSDLAASLAQASPTILLDLETGERVAHFAEVDVNIDEFSLDQQALYIRPVAALIAGRRYGVALRTTLKSRDGDELPRSAGFQAALDGRDTGHALLDAYRPRLETLFTKLETAGVPRDELLLAWDFTVASATSLTRDPLAVRDAVLTAAGEGAENLSFAIAIDDDLPEDDRIARRVVGTFTTPLILTADGGQEARLARDSQGAAMVVGTHTAKFAAIVPTCALTMRPAPIILFGHGFFGDTKEVQGEDVRNIAAASCAIFVGTEWYGMAKSDYGPAAWAINEASRLTGFGERILQGIADHLSFARLVRTRLASELFIDGSGSYARGDDLYFYGISQGGILGSVYLAYEPYINRAALSVGGGNWSLMFERSKNWPTFQLIIGGAYPGPLGTVIVESLLGLALDPVEPLVTAPNLVGTPLPGSSQKHVLIHTALGDTSVPNLGSFAQLRTASIPLLAPAAFAPWGTMTTTAPATSAAVIFDEAAAPLPPATNERFGVDNGTHSSIRNRPAALRQLSHFFSSGEIVNECAGACSCAEGACD